MYNHDVEVCAHCLFFDDDERICKLSGRNLDFLNLACDNYLFNSDVFDSEVSE